MGDKNAILNGNANQVNGSKNLIKNGDNNML
jgi:hypothetical protein